MAHTRLEKIGTIYTRITGLVRAGAMKVEDRPLWYDVYQAFPPKYPPQYDRPFPDEPIKAIYYPEDIIRVKFYRNIKNLPSVNLKDHQRQTLSQKCISLTQKLQKENDISLDEAFEKALLLIQGGPDSQNTKLDNETEAVENVKSPDIKNIFNT